MLVSVIIPCYNVEEYISECIGSVIGQTHSNIEIICIDNNSSDRTFQILQNLHGKYEHKITVLKEQKPGASCARNKGLSVAKGEWIQFLDADDLLLPNKIEHQIKIISENKDIGFIAGASFKQTVSGHKSIANVPTNDDFKALYTTKLGNTCSNIFNADKLRIVGGWNELLKSSQESDLMFNFLKRGFQVFYDNLPLTIIRERESGQISQRNPIEKWLQYIELRISIIDFLKSNRLDYFKKEKDFYYQNLFTQLRTLAKYDLEKATIIFKEHFEKKFLPVNSSGSSFYLNLFKIFGFKKAEQIRSMIGKSNSSI